ncbi:MAG: hypothetical protein PHD43_09550 [Methylococcales bacterium]|nr:hypothetical protein [Methylococcales bacterium]
MNFELGSRTTHTVTKLVNQIKHYLGILAQANPLKITTDKLAAYNNALQSVFTDIDYVYLQIVKKRIKIYGQIKKPFTHPEYSHVGLAMSFCPPHL